MLPFRAFMNPEIKITLAPDERRAQVSDLLLAEYLALAAQGYRAVVDPIEFQKRIEFLLKDNGNRSFTVSPQLAQVRAYLRCHCLTTTDVFSMLAGTRECPSLKAINDDPLRAPSLTFPHHEFRYPTVRVAFNDILSQLRQLFSRNGGENIETVTAA